MSVSVEVPSTEPAGRYRWVLLFGVWLVYFAFGLTQVAMAPLVGVIKIDLGLSDGAMGLILGAWPLVYIASAMPCGAFLDRVGPRKALFVAAAILAFSAAARGFANDQLSLFLAVASFGIGGPLISIGAPKLVSLWFEGPDRGLAMGIYITGPALGGISALALTNSVAMPLLDSDWRQVLFLYAAIALAIGLVWLALNQHPSARALEERATVNHGQRQSAVFLDLMKIPAVRLTLVMAMGAFFFNHGLNNWLPEILRRGGMTAAQAGYWAAIPTAMGVFSSLLIPRLATPARRKKILIALILGAGLSTLLLQHAGYALPLGLGLILQGVARGSLMTVMMLSLVETTGVGSRHAGAAGGMFFSAAEVGGVLGPITLGALSDLTGGFSVGLYLLSGICAVLILLSMRLRP
ncbi:MAG: MFS transporter [Rhodospirillaceae bacterium]|jgi:MFS transporter, CP family, cyanate transporter|nr:MFS transporter [Rhodospirillaceae bacterium]MBT5898685.1 MFS transporter [Rhodospirillaceae bacterium]MBT6427162.1 MFS transporter [Rhodospirillaceae bacterium]